MASVKFASVALVVVFAACAGLAAAYPQEDCRTQAKYFTNCLGYGIGERCCSVVANRNCLCLLERETRIHCIPGRNGCPKSGVAKELRLAEMHISCMRNLPCKRA